MTKAVTRCVWLSLSDKKSDDTCRYRVQRPVGHYSHIDISVLRRVCAMGAAFTDDIALPHWQTKACDCAPLCMPTCQQNTGNRKTRTNGCACSLIHTQTCSPRVFERSRQFLVCYLLYQVSILA